MFGLVPSVLHSRGAPFSPGSLPGLLAYYRVNTVNGVAGSNMWQDSARTTAATATGDPIGALDDLSGNGYHLTQVTNGNRMKLRLDSLGGLTSIVVDLITAEWLNFPAGFSVDMRACTVLAIVRPHSLGGPRNLFNFGTVGAGLLVDFDVNASVMRTFQAQVNLSTLRPYCNPIVLGVVAGASARTGYCGDIAAESGAAFNVASPTGGVLFARAAGGAPNYLGELYEFMVYNRALSAAEVAQIQAYSAGAYGSQSHTKQMVVDGDSLTEGSDSTQGREWAGVVGDGLGPSWRTYNYGYQGSTTVDLNNRRVGQIQNRYNSGYSKNIAVYWCGTNDLGVTGDTAANTFARLQTWCQAVKGAGFKVVVCTIIARNDAAWSGAKETERLALNTSINGLSSTYQDAIVDLAADARLSNANDATYFAAAKLHITTAGHAVVAGLVQTAVAAL